MDNCSNQNILYFFAYKSSNIKLLKLKDIFKKKNVTISKTGMIVKIDKKQLSKLTGGLATEPYEKGDKGSDSSAGKGAE
jgi:hypothetical protein